MKIALLTDGIYPYVIGGMQKHSFLLAKYLARNKVDVDLYHMNQSNLDISKLELFSEEEKKYIRSFVIDFPDMGTLPGHYIRESYEYAVRIFKEFSRNGPVDFIYAKGFCGWKLIDEKRKGFKCAPVGVNFHGYEMFQQAPTFRSKLEQWLFLRKPVLYNVKEADHVFSYGGRISEIIVSLGVEKNKIIEIPAGVEEDWLVNQIRVPDKVRRFVFAGRYERRKGIEELNSVLKELLGKRDFEFHFIGGIPLGKRILHDQIVYHDTIADPGKMRTLFDSCDILVCPSHSEGMPNVILEAMACGLCVIATDVGAISTLVNPHTGWLIAPGMSDKLRNAMTGALDLSADQLYVLKQNSQQHIRKGFLANVVFDRLIKRISELTV